MQQNNSLTTGEIPTRNFYPKSARLRKRSEFLKLKNSVLKYISGNVLVVWQENNLTLARLGVTVSKKIGCAVTRNRFKRLVREIFRNHRLLLPAVDLIVIARRDAATLDFLGLEQEMLKAFRHIGVSVCSKELHS